MTDDNLVVIVTGGRRYANVVRVFEVLDEMSPNLVVQGGAAGADNLAHFWSVQRGVSRHTYNAKWLEYGAAAGPIRNAQMLDAYPNATVVAFPGGKGTANCVSEAKKRNMKVIEISHEKT